jgi:glycosyltransferase involved in cell wall biosynthesis
VTRPGRLRVGVPTSLVRLTNTTGVGRMWHNVLEHLGRQVDISTWSDPHRSRLRPPPDVWLTDGHFGALGVPEPTVIHLQEASWQHESTKQQLKSWFVDQYEEKSREAAKHATAVLTPSESSRQQILEQYPIEPSRVHTVPLGVDLALFRPGRPGATDIIETAGGDPSAPYVLFVSSLSPRKNLGALKAAMNGLARRGLPHNLVIVASPSPDRRDWKEMAAEAAADLPDAPGRVVLLGSLSDLELATVTAGAAVFCLPSLMEGFGLTALEAMACGVPTVVSNRGSLPEVVGDAGIVVEPTAEGVEVALHDLLASPKRMEELSRAGLARAVDFSWKATAAGWLKVVRNAAPTPGLGPLEWVPPPGFGVQVVQQGVRFPLMRRRSRSTTDPPG